MFKSITKWYHNLTGKTVEQKIDEFGNVCGEVLLGIHNDLQKYRTENISLTQQIGKLDEAVLTVQKDLKEHKTEDSFLVENIKRLPSEAELASVIGKIGAIRKQNQIILIIALMALLIALGTMLWVMI